MRARQAASVPVFHSPCRAPGHRSERPCPSNRIPARHGNSHRRQTRRPTCAEDTHRTDPAPHRSTPIKAVSIPSPRSECSRPAGTTAHYTPSFGDRTSSSDKTTRPPASGCTVQAFPFGPPMLCARRSAHCVRSPSRPPADSIRAPRHSCRIYPGYPEALSAAAFPFRAPRPPPAAAAPLPPGP